MVPEQSFPADLSAVLDRVLAAHGQDVDHLPALLSQAWDMVRPRADELFALAQVLDRLGDQDGLREVEARLSRMETQRPRVALARGRVLRMLGRTAEAVPELARAARRGPKIVDTHLALCTAYLESGQAEKACIAGQTGLETHPSNFALRLTVMRAEAALDPDRVDLAALDALVAEAPARVAAQRFRLSLLRRLRRIEAARAAVDSFARACPGACDAALELAALDLLDGDPRAAQDRLAPVLEAPSPTLEQLERLGQAYGVTGSDGPLEQVLERLAELPATAQRHGVEGRLRLAGSDHAGALTAFDAAVVADPHRANAWGQLLDVLTQLGRGGDAFARYQTAPETIREMPEIAIKAANAAWAAGQIEAALSLLAMPEMTQHTAALRRLIEGLCALGRIGEARERLRDWRPANQGEQVARLIGLGIAARAEFDFPEVERSMLAALELDPHRVAPWWHLAHTRMLLCNPEGAMAAWKQMIALNRATGVKTMKHQGTLLWHKAEELQLDPSGTATLAAAWQAGPIALRDAATKAVLAGVDMIGPALSLVIASRQLGVFRTDDEASSVVPKASLIPHKLHQYWEGPLPEDLGVALQRMQDLNPEEAYHLYDRAEARAYLQTHAAPEVVKAFDLARSAAERADLFRLVLLGREGGIYVDADDLCRGKLRDLLPDKSQMVLFQEYHGALANNFLATVPNNPMLKRALESAVAETVSGAATSIWLRTGPGLITRAVAQALAENGGVLPNGWHILRQSDMAARLIICAPFSYKLDHRHWMKAS